MLQRVDQRIPLKDPELFRTSGYVDGQWLSEIGRAHV